MSSFIISLFCKPIQTHTEGLISLFCLRLCFHRCVFGLHAAAVRLMDTINRGEDWGDYRLMPPLALICLSKMFERARHQGTKTDVSVMWCAQSVLCLRRALQRRPARATLLFLCTSVQSINEPERATATFLLQLSGPLAAAHHVISLTWGTQRERVEILN
jgi:hypothetical protein